MEKPINLNIGCGGTLVPGYRHLDYVDYPHVDYLYDLNSGERIRDRNGILVEDNTFDEMICHHVFEHIREPLNMMYELWRVAKPGCKLMLVTPYGSSDNADEDPTHVRRVFPNTYVYFSQAWYGKNSYGYSGDWELQSVIFDLKRDLFLDAASPAARDFRIKTLRNVVNEFIGGLIAIKPARPPGFIPMNPHVKYRLV